MMKKWADNEVEFLKANYLKIGATRCSIMLNRTVNAVKKFAARAGLAAERRSFTECEFKYISENYVQAGPIAIAESLNVKRDSVYGVAQRFGLKMTSKARGAISTRTNTGRTMSEITRTAISKANKRYYEPNRCCDCRKEIMRKAARCRGCAAKNRGGPGHNWWTGGATPLYGAVFKRLYPAWKFPILERDDFECQDCGGIKHLEVHHIKLLTEIRDKVMDANPHLSIQNDKIELAELIVNEHRLDDGITLCRSCHEKCHWRKRGELLGHPNALGEDNQQPNRSNVISFVSRAVQRLTDEDITTNNSDTSAPHAVIATT